MENDNLESDGARVWWRRWSVVFILAVLAAFVVWALIEAGPWLRGWQERRSADALREQAEEQLHNDKYGGKTPEETFDMFIAALEKGDVELASKYFVVQKQDSWRKTLEEYQTRGLIVDFVKELNSNYRNWQQVEDGNKNTVSFKYKVLVPKNSVAEINGEKVEIPPGDYTNNTVFELYPSGIWKINLL